LDEDVEEEEELEVVVCEVVVDEDEEEDSEVVVDEVDVVDVVDDDVEEDCDCWDVCGCVGPPVVVSSPPGGRSPFALPTPPLLAI